MGGAQAIAAFAYGTRTVPQADRIVGPGNIYVAAAKKLLAGEIGIDFIAGPTEILIIAADGDPRHLAADMLAQAEHDVDASAILLTTSKRLALAVASEVERQLLTLPTAAVARQIDCQQQRHHLRTLAGRSHRHLQSFRARAPQHSRRIASYPESGTPAASSSDPTVPKRPETTPPAPTTSCPPAAPPAKEAVSPSPTT